MRPRTASRRLRLPAARSMSAHPSTALQTCMSLRQRMTSSLCSRRISRPNSSRPASISMRTATCSSPICKRSISAAQTAAVTAIPRRPARSPSSFPAQVSAPCGQIPQIPIISSPAHAASLRIRNGRRGLRSTVLSGATSITAPSTAARPGRISRPARPPAGISR